MAHRATLGAVATLATIVLAGCATSRPTATFELSRRPEPCRVAQLDEEVRCATITVPENRRRPELRRIPLNVVILPAKGLAARPPLFILQGGPGQAASDLSDFYAETFAAARKERDIVLVDQRGTGRSNPLDCARGDEDAPPRLRGLFPLDLIRRCRAELEQRADLRFYTTTVAMQDLDAVRQALGYDRLSLYGTSYGTRAALVYLRLYPERVERMILKGVLPMDEVAPLSFAVDSQRSLQKVIEDCEADAACRSRYPAFASDVEAVFSRLGDSPAGVTVKHGEAEASVTLSQEVLATAVRSLLQAVGTQAMLPSLFRSGATGNFRPLAELVLPPKQAGAAGVYEGMQLSVICSEDAPHIPPGAERRDSDTFLAGYWTGPLVEACRNWPRGEVPKDFRRVRRSSVPLLLISGYSDPATPPAGAERVARGFPDSRHVVVRYGSHSFSGMGGCVDVIMADFIAGAAPAELDIRCASKIQRPAWNE